ncbi:MAG: glycerol kinase [Desulfobulbus sp.]|nr:MAG: glycerol kinase [Desulfobulbus sp.]
MAILAIDQGTTSTRAFVVDDSGEGRVVKAVEHKQYYPHPGWVEHDPEELIRHIELCINGCTTLDAIGIDNQGESCLAWNSETKKAISPVIVWQDSRTEPVIESLKNTSARERVLERAGLPLDSYFPAAKFGWILQNVPEAQDLLSTGKLRFGTTDAFFLDRLTGRFVTDISTASRTSLMNLQTGRWDQDLCDLFGVPMETLPEICPTTTDFGTIDVHGKRIPVTASVVDQQAALYGHGCRESGDVKITFGTGAFVMVVTGDTIYQAADKGLLPTVAWQKHGEKPVYALDGGVFSAASAINWAKSLGLFAHFDQINSFDQSDSPAIARDLVFVPALTGLGCPYWDRKAGGTWVGLTLDATAMDLVQSILEGIAFRAAEVIETMHRFVPIRDEISIDGGLSANPYFCQFLAGVLDREVIVQSTAELTALGTAELAAGGKGVCVQDKDVKRYEPRTEGLKYMDRFKEAVSRSQNWRR